MNIVRNDIIIHKSPRSFAVIILVLSLNMIILPLVIHFFLYGLDTFSVLLIAPVIGLYYLVYGLYNSFIKKMVLYPDKIEQVRLKKKTLHFSKVDFLEFKNNAMFMGTSDILIKIAMDSKSKKDFVGEVVKRVKQYKPQLLK